MSVVTWPQGHFIHRTSPCLLEVNDDYRTYRVYAVGSNEAKPLAREYELNNEVSYVLETAYVIPGLCFHATRRFTDIGRLMNHSASGHNMATGPS